MGPSTLSRREVRAARRTIAGLCAVLPMSGPAMASGSAKVERWTMAGGALGTFIRDYIGRVVNEHDISAVDEMVSPDYRGTGPEWQRLAPDFEALRAFYQRQATQRPDWCIDIQESIEVGEYVAVRALASGKQAFDDDGARRRPPFPTEVEWLTVYHVVEGRIVESRVVTSVVRSQA